MRQERRILSRPIELRVDHLPDGDRTTIVGHASVFFRADDPGTEFELWPGVVERIMPGAFDRAIAEDDVRALFNHNPDNILGRNTSGTMKLFSDDIGLRFEIDPPDDEFSSRMVKILDRGDVSGSSIAFIATDETWSKENDIDIRSITGMRLFDVGPVTFPAFTSTDSGLRANGDCKNARDSFDRWQSKIGLWRRNHVKRVADMAAKGIDLR